MENHLPASEKKSNFSSSKPYVVAAAFFSLLAIVGFALYGLTFFYDFFIDEFGWSRTVVTSGNAIGKLLVAPLFGFIAGWIIDRYGPGKMMLAGSLMAVDLFGVKTLGRVMGIILIADGLAESLSPMMVGALYNDALKSYTLGFTALICIALTGALIVSFLPRQSIEKTISPFIGS
jgi:MFS family permease